MKKNFKPWGKFDWILSKIDKYNFNFLGCLATEDRCLEAFKILLAKQVIENFRFLEILDPDPSDTVEHKENRKKNLENLMELVEDSNLVTLNLLCPISEVQKFVLSFIDNSNGNIILDIS